MPDWTPGPWRVFGADIEDGLMRVVSDNPTRVEALAADANARLISLAPEMAELLEDWAARHHAYDVMVARTNDLLSRVREEVSAIA